MRGSTNQRGNPRSPHLQSNTTAGADGRKRPRMHALPICTWMKTGWMGECCVSGALGVHVLQSRWDMQRDVWVCEIIIIGYLTRDMNGFLLHVPESGKYEFFLASRRSHAAQVPMQQ